MESRSKPLAMIELVVWAFWLVIRLRKREKDVIPFEEFF